MMLRQKVNTCFRPLIGVIISKQVSAKTLEIYYKSFRPLIGVIISKLGCPKGFTGA